MNRNGWKRIEGTPNQVAVKISCYADLIVMGAYGRSRLCKRVFGGTPRSVLKHLRTPVFLSH